MVQAVQQRGYTGKAVENPIPAPSRQYAENGFYCARGLVGEADFSALTALLLAKINRYVVCDTINAEQWVKFARENAPVVSALYDEMRDHECFLDIGRSPALVNLVKTFIPNPLLYKKVPFRIDVPFEVKELAHWHQDDFYVKGNAVEMTVWIPLENTFIYNGCLSVMPGSHLLGKIPHTYPIGKKTIPEHIYDREVRLVEMMRGDALFFSSFLVHSSNINVSCHIRYSIQLRYTSGDYELSEEMKGTVHV